VHQSDVDRGGDGAGADRPDRLVGQDQLGVAEPFGERAGELAGDHRDMIAGEALGLGLADADDRLEAGGERGLGLGADDRVGLALLGAALGMPDDDQPRARFLEHRHRDAAGMGPARLEVAVLCADQEPAAAGDGGRDQGERRADGDVDSGGLARRVGDRRELGQSGEAAVHLPIADDQLAADVHLALFLPSGSAAPSRRGRGRQGRRRAQRHPRVAGAPRSFYGPPPTGAERPSLFQSSPKRVPSMLRAFRSKLSSWLMLAFLGLAVGAIVITGFGTGGMGGLPSAGQAGGETLVEVGGEEVDSTELEQLVRRRFQVAQQQNPELDFGRFLAEGAFEGILNETVIGRALWAFGRANGITVTDRMIDRVIANVPEFRNFAGQFDEATYRQTLDAQNLSEAQLRREIANYLMQRQLQLPIGMATRMPESVAVQYASLMLERRRGSIGMIRSDAMTAGYAPSNQEVAAYFQRNRTRYTVPERRVLRYALIGREQVAAAATPSEQEIEAYYRQNSARYAGSETRTLQQVVLPSEAAARRFVQRAGGGANFAAAAQQAGFGATDIALGQQSREQYGNLTNSEAANAVFSAQQGAVVGPLRSELGWHVVRVESINRANARPLDAVRGEIATELTRRKIADALVALVARIEEKIDEGASFEDIVRAERLTMAETPAITGAGQAPGVQWQAPAELRPLLRTAFQVDPEDPAPAVETIAPNERYAFLSVARVIPAAVPPLAQIAAQVRADVVRQTGFERARTLAQRLADRINSGVPPARAFAEAGVRLQPPTPLDLRRLDLARSREVPPVMSMFLSVPQGRARTLEGPNRGGWYVVHVAQRTPGQASCPANLPPAQQQQHEGCLLIQAARQEFSARAGSEYTEQFARAVQNGLDTRRNEPAIARLRQRLRAETAQ